MKHLTISVIGLGYIGLPTAALLAGNGYSVLGVDISQLAVSTINQGKIHIVEPDLELFVRSAVSAGRLKASTKPQAGDVYIICVPTPLHDGEGFPKPNIDHVMEATMSIAGFVKQDDLIILESTCPVGTTEKIQNSLRDFGVDVNKVHIAYCPERVLPGNIMIELVENDRIVGGVTAKATKTVADFYRTFVQGNVVETDAKTAEMCKLTENSFRDVNIAFANELSLICDNEGVNVWEVIQLANRHPRVNILQPGVGVGGHCIAVDPWFIVNRDQKNARLIRTAREVNLFKADWVVNQIKSAVAEFSTKVGLKPKIACLGLAFKPDIDDLRESPALNITQNLIAQGYDVVAVEPNLNSHPEINLVTLEQLKHEDYVVAVLVKHSEFTKCDLTALRSNNLCIDFCGVLISADS
ncbi:UDP-N-acetyl-D-mannosamine dehydrogenase [Alphaproteobacteria bacterium]|nr:UDP-N-acetyl-D-mannosamine dehydrogenase [Alphaproteobacteria bacterium]